MSTKCTLACGDHFHLYEECFDDNFIYLEINDVTVKIPSHIWEVIRNKESAAHKLMLECINLTDSEIYDMVTEEVAFRIKVFQAGSKFAAILGAMVYGSVELPVEEQINNGVAYYQHQRIIAQEFKEKLAKLC